jgi:hypothetical protein
MSWFLGRFHEGKGMDKRESDFQAFRWTFREVTRDLRERGVLRGVKDFLWYGIGGVVITVAAIYCHFPPYDYRPEAQTAIYIVMLAVVTLVLWYIRCLHVLPAKIDAERRAEVDLLKVQITNQKSGQLGGTREETEAERKRKLIQSWREMIKRVTQWWQEHEDEVEKHIDKIRKVVAIQPEYASMNPYMTFENRQPEGMPDLHGCSKFLHPEIGYLIEITDSMEWQWSLRDDADNRSKNICKDLVDLLGLGNTVLGVRGYHMRSLYNSWNLRAQRLIRANLSHTDLVSFRETPALTENPPGLSDDEREVHNLLRGRMQWIEQLVMKLEKH